MDTDTYHSTSMDTDIYHNTAMDTDLKFGDGDGPNHCRVKKVYVSSTFIVIVIRLRFQGYCCESDPTKFNEGSLKVIFTFS